MYLTERARLLFSYQNHLPRILLGMSIFLLAVSLSLFGVLQWQFKETLEQVNTQHTENLLTQIGQQSIRFIKQGDQRRLQYVAENALKTTIIEALSIFDAQGVLTARAQNESFQEEYTTLHVLEITEFNEKTVGYVKAHVLAQENTPWQLLKRLKYQLWSLSLCLLLTGIALSVTWIVWRRRSDKTSNSN